MPWWRDNRQSVSLQQTINICRLRRKEYLPDYIASSESIATNVFTNAARICKIMSCLRNHRFVNIKEGIGYIHDSKGQSKRIFI
ncbi:hypothetical protein E2R53_04855 [Peribacillus frigoritolerans]|nr:hypothetical protein E2R53_04855 [Peribacillus frigoritolerans]